jgi:diguanylate cyclase (GGDEF)-like protein
LTKVRDVWLLLACAALGAGIGGSIAAAALARVTGGSFLTAYATFITAHPAGVLLIGSVALAGPRIGDRLRHPAEVGVQTGAALALTVLVFGPTEAMPLSFVPLAAIAWSAARFGPRVTAVQALVLAVLVSVLTVNGHGPFAQAGRTLGIDWLAVRLAQLYIIILVILMLALALAVNESARRALELAEREDLFRRTFDEAMLGMLLVEAPAPGDTRWQISRANPVAQAMLHPHHQLLGADLAQVLGSDFPGNEFADFVDGRLDHLQRDWWLGETAQTRRRVSVAMSPLRDPAGALVRVAVQLIDSTEQVRAQERLQALAMTDPLTGLANRALLEEDLSRRLRETEGQRLLLVFVDLDDFKIVNDSSGHVVGDEVLLAVASGLAREVPEGALVARLGGDEFVVLHACPPDAQAYAQRLASTLIEVVSRPITVAGRVYRVGASIGMTVSRPDSTMESLLREADSAMFQAKREGKNRFSLFSQHLQDAALRRITLSEELHTALAEGQFALFVQPVIDLRTGRITGGECLLRWRHPTRGLLLPEEWLDVAEDSPIMHRLGSWVLTEACRLAADWPVIDGDGPPRTVHANVSASQLGHRTLVSDVRTALAESGLAPERLVLELTETELAREEHVVLAEIDELRRAGVRLAADDVGTGYSSLTRLTDMPIDILKIDRTFVTRMRADDRARAVVEGLVTLGSAMGLDVVAEGVESADVAAPLRDLGCPSAQGFLWNPAVPADDFTGLITLDDTRAALR